MCLAISYVVINIIVYILLNIAALFAMCIGMFLLIREAMQIRSGKKWKIGGRRIV